MSVLDHLKTVLQLTKEKRFESDQLYKEYFKLEETPPAPGQPHRQHGAMVKKGLCIEACNNPYKNRYCNLFPFDTNLVTLNQDNSYINASWIQLPGASNRYIAAMGPMHPSSYSNKLQPDSGGAEDTVPDFWQLCWQTKARVVVMLCTLQTGFTGCSPYYPEDPGTEVTFTPFTISLKDTNNDQHFSEKRLVISKNGETETREVIHLQFKSWPNYGVPEETAHIADFVRLAYFRANHEKLEKDQPELIVHCSGGIGRTGTFLSAYQTYSRFEQLLRKKVVPERAEAVTIFGLVDAMRRERHPWMVEGFQQFEMAYDIIIHLLEDFVR